MDKKTKNLFLQKDGTTDKSPLQMLAQTCSQIGADSGPKMTGRQSLSSSPSTSSQASSASQSSPICHLSSHNIHRPKFSFADKQKSITSGDLKSSKSSAPKSSSSPTIIVSDSGTTLTNSTKPVPFKPYEIAKEAAGAPTRVESRKSSLNSSDGSSGKALGASSSPLLGRTSRDGEGMNGSRRDTSSPRTTSSSSETTPTLSSGMEILAGHPKDLPLGTYRPPVPGALDPHNPAFRLPGLSCSMPGFPSTSSVAGSVCRDPYCKDPNCPTAVYNAYMARMSAARGGLPPGYLELMEAHKMAALGLGGLGSPPPSVPTSLAASAALGPGGPYICNWMNGRDYCGKRYTSAEELLVHLKTHTNLSASDSGLLAGAGSQAAAYANLLAGASAASLMGRGAAGGPVLPSSLAGLGGAGRYSPYQRPGAPLPPSLAGAAGGFPPSLAALHPSFASLAGYPASLYALYGARL